MKKLTLLGIFLFSLLAISLQAQTPEKTIKLVVSGEAETKEEATKIALRNAIEQAFGTFVSADTEILNDELVKDEIVSISSGNIQSYKEVSSLMNADGTQSVTLEAIVSIGKLVNFAQSKGMSTELAGATFAMNMKIKELNKKNERIALKNLYEQLDLMASNLNLFDYELITGEPYEYASLYAVDLVVNIRPNNNAIEFAKYYIETMMSLSLTESEIKEYQSANLRNYDTSFGLPLGGVCYLRNDYWPKDAGHYQFPVELAFVKSIFKFRILDNMENRIDMLYTDVSTREIQNEIKIISLIKDNVRYHSLGEENIFSGQRIDYNFVSFPVTPADNFYGEGHTAGSVGWMHEQFDDFVKNYKGQIFRQLKFTMYYQKDAFEKLSSIKVEPTSSIRYVRSFTRVSE